MAHALCRFSEPCDGERGPTRRLFAIAAFAGMGNEFVSAEYERLRGGQNGALWAVFETAARIVRLKKRWRCGSRPRAGS